jgi:hypothetical protein
MMCWWYGWMKTRPDYPPWSTIVTTRYEKYFYAYAVKKVDCGAYKLPCLPAQKLIEQVTGDADHGHSTRWSWPARRRPRRSQDHPTAVVRGSDAYSYRMAGVDAESVLQATKGRHANGVFLLRCLKTYSVHIHGGQKNWWPKTETEKTETEAEKIETEMTDKKLSRKFYRPKLVWSIRSFVPSNRIDRTSGGART